MQSDSPNHPQTQPMEEDRGSIGSNSVLPEGFSIFYLLFFLSGLCALIYEIAWTRRLTLIFGNTVYSISTVLFAFMGGLALGSLLFGRIIDKRNDPIRVYAFLEIGIGLFAVILPFILSALNPAYRYIFNNISSSNYALSLIRFLMSAGVLILPTTLMGATLPVLSKFVVQRSDRTGSSIGSLYAINTLGAVCGCLLAGFVLIGLIGVTKSEYFAASINILIGLAALALQKKAGTAPVAEEEPLKDKGEATEDGLAANTAKLVLLIFGLSGMAALAYEVLWSRILVFLLGSAIYSFTMILAVYLLGLTCGSLVFARHADSLKRPLQVFGWLEILIGLVALAGLVLFVRLPFMPFLVKVSSWTYLAKNFFGVFVIVLPPTFLMGAAFPVAVRVYARTMGSIGKQTGSLYAVNTFGAIAGSFLSGFVFIPLVGAKNSVLLVVLISFVCGFLLLLMSIKQEGASGLNRFALALLALPILGVPFGNDLMKELSVKLLEDRTRHDWEVITITEDATAAVAVGEDADGMRLLTVNGISMTYLHLETQMMAHLPLSLMDNPKNVLIICFGMGTTFVSAKRAGMDVDFVELCPAVVDAFSYYQDDPSMIDEPGSGKIIADGRNYVLLSEKKYDLITIDPPPPPYSAGTVNLYTREFYELCKERLTPTGAICQWIPMQACTDEQYKMLFKTFLEVFPHTTVWRSINNMGTYLIGSPQRLRINRKSLDEYFSRPEVRKDLLSYTDEVTDGKKALSLLMLDENGAHYYAEGAAVLTDDLPVIEFPLFRSNEQSELMRLNLIYGRHQP